MVESSLFVLYLRQYNDPLVIFVYQRSLVQQAREGWSFVEEPIKSLRPAFVEPIVDAFHDRFLTSVSRSQFWLTTAAAMAHD